MVYYVEKAAVLVERLARNHPLPDGKSAPPFLALDRFLAVNGRPLLDADPDTDVPMMERIAAGDATPSQVEGWLDPRTTSKQD